jgi:hypothetical protein
VVPQAGLFSAALTAFVVDSKQNLKPSPADETVYYLRQHSIILSQISTQLSSIAPQVTIPSTPPPPFPSFSPLASDVRVNVFWFMALAFSLLAALLAILVQQWVRNYMHVFQRYSDPLKCSRLRQYLYKGCKRWYMPRVAEAVPGFLHISLFLFFAGLGDSLLNINTKVALSAIVPIGVSGLLYIFTTFAPIIYPQSPYQNSFSGIIWYLFQKLRGRRFRDRGPNGVINPVDANMAQGQMQLAMEETPARKGRDVEAIQWLIVSLTEDAEMENFLSAIPGSFNADWGADVWKMVGNLNHDESEDESQDESVVRPHRDTTAHQPSSSWIIRSVLRPIIHLVKKPAPGHHPTHATTRSPAHPHSTTVHPGVNVVRELSTRVGHSVKIWKNRNRFSNNDDYDLWRKRGHACIEAAASLVCCANAKLAWFGDISKPLGDICSLEKEKIRELLLARTDELFVMRWTCLSLVAIRPILADSGDVQYWARKTMEQFARADDTGNNDALAVAQEIDETLQKAKRCLNGLYGDLRNTEDLTEVKTILRGHESDISELEQINIKADRLGWADDMIFNTQHAINYDSHQITSQIPGVLDDEVDYVKTLIPFGRFVEVFRDPRKLLFIHPGQTLKNICFPATTLLNILDGLEDADAYKELSRNLEDFSIMSYWRGHEMQRQLWRLQDLGDGGGLGFTVELFFLALKQLLSTSSSKESHSALYKGTFRAITSDWSEHKDSLGTQKLLLDIVMSRSWEFDVHIPAYIIDDFLVLLRDIFKGQAGPHINKAKLELTRRVRRSGAKGLDGRLLKVITEIGALPQSLPV